MKSTAATLLQCDPAWKRLHGQRVSFEDWPKGGRTFRFSDERGLARSLSEVVGVEFQGGAGGRRARFKAGGTRFELVAD